ncbi:MAG: phosphodiesterase [Pseudomonadota bacterium]
MHIVQLSDLHATPLGTACYRVAETNMLLERAVSAVLALDPAPDCVLISGDLTDLGQADEYVAALAALQRLPMPVYAIPGNHDTREEFRVAFSSAAFYPEHDIFVHYAIETHMVRIIALDTTIPDSHAGELCDERLDWFETKLAEDPDRPTLVMMHHPPFDCGIGFMDAIALLDGRERFAEIVQANAQIERVVCGHHHRPIQARFAGTLAQIAPATGHQVALDLTPEPRAQFVMEPPAFLIHRYAPETGIVTHQA